MSAAEHPGLARCTSDPAGRLRSETSMARAMADTSATPEDRRAWLSYARGIDNALRVLGHPAGSPEPPLCMGVPVSPELLDAVEAIAIACASEGVTLAEWYRRARAAR